MDSLFLELCILKAIQSRCDAALKIQNLDRLCHFHALNKSKFVVSIFYV